MIIAAIADACRLFSFILFFFFFFIFFSLHFLLPSFRFSFCCRDIIAYAVIALF